MKYIVFLVLFCSLLQAQMVRKNNLEVVIDTNTKLMWIDNLDVIKIKKNHEDSIEYCENLVFAGYSNWRIPTIDEFKTIVNKKNYKNYINYRFKYNVPDGYWALKAHWRTLWFYADYMHFVSGTPYYDSRHKTKYIRCVRSM
ncbi:DUF1566 domain-containing protein [Arcobacter sp. YIC-464]|uniref:Lcl C-terminal domain-containing protein n=1 Tax=Arcobacter sp. YIC-464 TaxID=3376631 RepID=UPI003C251478